MQGLLEAKKVRLYFSGRVKSRSSEFEIEADKIRINDFVRGEDDKLVLICNFSGVKIKYKVERHEQKVQEGPGDNLLLILLQTSTLKSTSKS